MSLPPLATLEQLQARHPLPIQDDEEPRAEAVLDDASAVVRFVAGKTWVDDDDNLVGDIPGIVVTVTLGAALRAFRNPDGARQETLGSYSVTLADASTNVYLTEQEERNVRRASGRTGIWTQATTRGDCPDTRAGMLDTGCGDDLTDTWLSGEGRAGDPIITGPV